MTFPVPPLRAFSGALNIAAASPLFGTGADGNVTISSGTTTLTRDMNYRNLTITGTGGINTNGWRVFVAGTLDLTTAPTGAISLSGPAGTNATVQAGAANSFLNLIGVLNGGAGGSNGGNGGAAGGAGSAGVGGVLFPTSGVTVMGGDSQAGGNGGASATPHVGGAGGTAKTPSGNSRAAASFTLPTSEPLGLNRALSSTSAFNPLMGGASGAGGGGGGGDVANAGGGGGSGGNSGGVLQLYAKYLNRGVNTAVGAIQSTGGTGGNGAPGLGGTAGGGGGGSGGGGGVVYAVIGQLLGTTANIAIDVSGGAGGTGGSSAGGTAGGGGIGSNSGNYQITVLAPPTFTVGGFNVASVFAPVFALGGAGGVNQGNL